MVKIEPELYTSYLTQEQGQCILYVEILKALYGMIQSPLLFYRKLKRDLGFKVNPYNPYVANKMMNGYQMTVT